MSTADCKALLVKHYPATQEKDWKRESKFKSVHDYEIRRFRHPVVGIVLVNEDRNSISTDELAIEFRMRTSYTPADFYFYVVMIPEEEADCHLGAKANVWVTYKNSFEKEDGSDDIHWSSILRPFYPKGIHCEDAMEGCLEIRENLTEEQIREKFLAAGFLTNAIFDANTRSDLDLEEPPQAPQSCSGQVNAVPGDFYFQVDDSYDLGEQLQVFLVRRSYFDQHGFVDSIHLSDVIEPLFPEGLTCDEEMESCFIIYEVNDPAVLTQMFLDKGFILMPETEDDDSQQ